jgi:hypothetical protein
MNRIRAWGFAVGLAIAWFVGLAVVCTRLGEANGRDSIFVAAPHSTPGAAGGRFVR